MVRGSDHVARARASDTVDAVRLRSFKVRFREDYAWVVPAEDLAGEVFAAPGITLRGESAARARVLAAAVEAALAAFEPGVRVRSLAVDVSRPRVLATLEPTTPDADPRGRVVRLEHGAALDAALAAARPLVGYLEERASEALARRAREATGG